jgi:hypothetical protein
MGSFDNLVDRARVLANEYMARPVYECHFPFKMVVLVDRAIDLVIEHMIWQAKESHNALKMIVIANVVHRAIVLAIESMTRHVRERLYPFKMVFWGIACVHDMARER